MDKSHILRLSRFGSVVAIVLLFGVLVGTTAAYAAETQVSSGSGSPASSPKNTKAALAGEKSETVYVSVDADGGVTGVEVETLLTNPNADDELVDTTSLPIAKVTDDVEYEQSQDNLIWHADGADVRYRTTADGGVPVSLTISYTLDGKPMSAQQLLGKSGLVTIRYEFKNLTGASDKDQVPLIAVAGLMLDADLCSNVAVDHGRVVQDDGRIVVIGYAFPGLEESLDAGFAGIDMPSSFEVTANVEDFELGSMLVMVSGNALDDFDEGAFDTAGLAEASVGLKDAMAQILEASSKLNEGLTKLAEASHALNEGIKELASGIGELDNALPSAIDGVSSLSDGADAIYEGSQALAGGIDAVAQGSAAVAYGIGQLTGDGDGQQSESVPAMAVGAHQLSEGLLKVHQGTSLLKERVAQAAAAGDQLAAALSGDSVVQAATALAGAATELQADLEVLTAVGASAAQLVSDAEQVQDDIDSAIAALDAIVVSAVDDPQLAQAIEQAKSDLAAAQSSASGLVDEAAAVAESAETLSTDNVMAALNVLQSVDLSQVHDAAATLAEGLRTIEAGFGTDDDANTLLGGVKAAQEAASTLANGLDALASALAQLNSAAQQVAKGAAQLANEQAGMPALVDGAQALSVGMHELSGMMTKVKEVVDALNSGSEQLASGSGALAQGMDSAAEGAGEFETALNAFNEQGIAEIARVIDEDVVGLSRRLSNLADNGRAYDNFGGKAAGTPSSVKFVFEVSGIQYES